MANQFKTVLLLGVLTTLFVGLGAIVAPGMLWLFTALAVAMNIGAYYMSDKLVLRMHGAREVTEAEAPGLHRIVAELASRAGVPKPRLAMIDDPQPNAFATGRNPEHGVVAVTTGIVDLLSERELRGVLAHEIAHIKNRDILVQSVAAVMGSAIAGVANALQFGAMFGGSSQSEDEAEGSTGSGLLVALVAPIGATLVQFGISRSREYLADDTGARIAGDPESLANALLKLQRAAERIPGANPIPATASLFIVNPLAGLQRMGRWFSTHPPIEDRVNRLLLLADPMDANRSSRLAS